MKTTKLILAIVFFAFSTMVFSQAARPDQNEPVPTFSTKISIKAALENPTIVKAMRVQLNPAFLNGPYFQRVYTVKVKLPNVVISIHGTRTEWINFFKGHIRIDLTKADG